MQTAWIITKRELKAYFDGLTGYIVLTFFLLVTGWFFGQSLFLNNVASVQTVFDLAPILFMFFIPALTMGAFSEERRNGTLELLLTMPAQDWQVILGKLLTTVVLVSVAIALTLLYAFVVAWIGDPDGGALVGGYLGLLLYGITCGAVGVYASSLTKNQIVAYILAFALLFVLFLLDKSTVFLPAGFAAFAEYLGTDFHYKNLLRGVLDTRDLIYYASIITMASILTAHNLAKRD